MVESQAVFGRRRFHRAKAHLVLSRDAAPGRRARRPGRPTSRPRRTPRSCARARRRRGRAPDVVRRGGPGRARCGATGACRRGASRPSREDFERWAEGRGGKRLLMEDFYRDARLRATACCVDGGEPAGGQWNFDHDNREPPPKGRRTLGVTGAVGGPARTTSTREVREDLDRWERDGDVAFIGRDGPRLLRGHPARGAGRARPLRRAPAAGVRRPRGRDPRGRPVDGARLLSARR